jgi:hypothetical protein
MANPIYKQVELYVIDKFTQAGDGKGIRHFLRTVHWVKKLKPDADEALLIAAVAHDIERAFRKHETYDKIKKSEKGFRSDEHLTHHQKEGARIISEYLEQIGADKKTIERVRMLVSMHEVGGNDDQNLLKDADSVSFFENNGGYFVAKRVEDTGKGKVKDKFDRMYNRMTSERAKALARQLYGEALKKLGDC